MDDMDPLLQDVRYALRTLRRRPAFTAVAAVTLGLGIGATTAIFSVVDTVLLRPLPFRESESLVSVNRTYPSWREDDILRANWDAIAFSYPTFRAWRDAQTSFSEAGAWATYLATVTDGDRPALLTGVRVSPSLLPLLGVQPLVGRTFLPDDGLPSAPRTLILGFETWVSRYGADPSVVGRTVRLDDTPFTIIGVVPARVNLTGRGDPPAVWIPAGVLPQDQSANNNQFRVVARLAPGVSLARAELETVRLVRGDEDPAKLGARLAFWQREQTRTTRTPLLILLGAAGLLLAIACGNVAMLLLGESAAREHEMASRLALGAGHWRLVRQLLTESVMLACIGGALGVTLAFAGTKALVALAPPQIPRLYEVATDLRVLAVAVAGAVGTGVLFGVAPALSLARTSPASLLSAGSRSVSRRRGVMQRTLIAAELALCLVLLVGAALLAQSLRLLAAVDPGFRAENLTVVKVSMPRSRYAQDSTRTRAFYMGVMERIAAVPGVERVSATSGAPFDLSTSSTSLEVEGRAAAADAQSVEAEYRVTMPGYFETVGIPLLGGRTFTDADRLGAPLAIIVNATLARQAWPNESAIRKRLRYDEAWHTVVGVVGDIKNAGLAAEPQAMFYLSALQEHWPSQRFVIRTGVSPEILGPAVRQAIAAVDPGVPVTAIDGMPELMSRSIAEPRYRTVLISLFGLVAAVLAAVGVYGVTARAVSLETREIGIRMALGSSGGAVIRLFISRTMIGVATGVAVGLVGAFAASRLLAPYLFGVKPSDPVTFAAVLGLLVVVSAAASWLPARIASRTNPAVVLRRSY
jgi:putative ABC transport system permease protein